MSPPAAFAPLSVEARDLSCTRGGRPVLAGVSFRALAGDVLTVVGPNGSGKSTLLRAIAGLLRLDAGILHIEGRREDEPVTHYLGHADSLKAALTLAETISFWARLYGGRSGLQDSARAAERVGLGHALNLPTGVLSAGQRRRAGLARLLVAPRPIWLLDEPTSALDSDGEALLGRLIGEHIAAGGLAIVATHQPLPVGSASVLDLSA